MSSPNSRRRSAAIHAYVGPNGGGKSLAMVSDTLASLERGRPVLSTVRILDPATGDPHPLYRPLTGWQQLLEFGHGDVLLDEVQGVANSRGHTGLPPAVLTLLLQLRRRDVLLRWSAPSYARADLVLREVTQAVTWCKGAFPEPVQDGRLWAPNRLFYWRTYPAADFDEFSSGKRDTLDVDVRQLYARERVGPIRKNSDNAQDYYDTLAPVDFIVDVVETGTCLRCGGTRRRPKCECDEHQGPPASEARTAPSAPLSSADAA